MPARGVVKLKYLVLVPLTVNSAGSMAVSSVEPEGISPRSAELDPLDSTIPAVLPASTVVPSAARASTDSVAGPMGRSGRVTVKLRSAAGVPVISRGSPSAA